MLDIIRTNTRSFGVKVAFGIIILVFVFWGIGNITDTGSINVVGMVNEVPITFQTYETTYRRAEEQATRSGSGRIDLSAADKQALGHQVFSTLVSNELLHQEAARHHIAISPYEIRLYVDGIEAFRGDDGKFDAQTYKNVLAQQRQTPAQFEDGIRRELLRSKMIAFVVGGGWMDDSEPRGRFDYLRQSRTVEYLYLSAKEAGQMADPGEQACRDYYDAHKDRYAVPQKADVEYIAVDPLTVVKADSVSDEDARAWFGKHADSFVEPKTVDVSHILVLLAPNASEEEVRKAEEKVKAIQDELAAGKDFAEVADAHNPAQAGGKGGKVGWIRPGMTVAEFETAAYATPKGTVSAPVRSQFGLHLIRVDDVKEGSSKTYEDVSGEVKASIAQDRGREQIGDILDGMVEDNILGKPMADMASSRGLEVIRTGALSEAELIEKLGVKQEDADIIMKTTAGSCVDVPMEAGDHYLVARVAATEPAAFRPFDEVRTEVADAIRSDGGVDAGRAALQDALKAAGSGDLPAALQANVKVSDPIARGESLPAFDDQKDLADAIFAAAPGSWIPTVFEVSGAEGRGVLVCRVKSVAAPEDIQWNQFSGIMTQLMQRERADGLYQAFMKGLFERSEVRVMNQKAIDRTGM